MVSKAKAAAAAALAEQETPEQRAAKLERARLRNAADKQGMLSGSRRICQHPNRPSRLLQRANGKDIVKKSSVRKNRFMLVFNVAITPKAGGKLGTLKKLDTQTPVMYMDFPEGRLKFFGTLVFPRNKYIMLKIGNKDILCEDIFESMVVFSEVWWVGTAEENPEERRLEMPASVAERRLHEEEEETGAGVEEAAAKEEESEQEDDKGKEEGWMKGARAGKPMRAAAKGALKVLRGDDSDDLSAEMREEEEGSEGGSYDGVGVIGKRSSQEAAVTSSGEKEKKGVRTGGTIQSLFEKAAATAAGKEPSATKSAGVGGSVGVKGGAAKKGAAKATSAAKKPLSLDRPQRRAAAKKIKYDDGLDSDDPTTDDDEDSSEE